MHPIRELILARLREFWREPAAIFWVYGFPLIMMIALGVAFLLVNLLADLLYRFIDPRLREQTNGGEP